MPLWKGKGCKSTPGKVIDYITDEKKAEIVSSLNLEDNRDYAEQFQETARMYDKGTGYDERKYYHFKLSCARADAVSAAAHHEYAEALAAKLFPGYECVVATHTDTDTVHSHIIVNAVSFETGRKLDIRNTEYRQQKDLANELGTERGFTSLNWRQATQEKRLRLEQGEVQQEPQIEKYMQQSFQWEKKSWKEQLRQVIDEAKGCCCDRQAFQKYLLEYGVEMPRNTEKSVSFIHPAVTQKSVRGNVLGEAYTAKSIDEALQHNLERSIEDGRYDTTQNPDGQRAATTEGRTETNGNGEHIAESSVGAVERKMRELVEGVRRLASGGGREAEDRAAAEQRTAQPADARVEWERKQSDAGNDQEDRDAGEREPDVIRDDYEPDY